MKASLGCFAIGIVLLSLTSAPLRAQGGSGTYQNLTVGSGSSPGTLTVMGTPDFMGNALTFGSWTGSGTAGLAITFTDVSGTNPAVLQLSASRTAQEWLWTQQTASGSTAPMLMLDATNKLNLYSTSNSGSASIILDPTNGKITINGQVIGGGSGVWNTSGSNIILSSGSVGIDTASPAYALDVRGTIGNGASGGYINLNDSNNGISIIPGSGNPITFADNVLSSDAQFAITSGTARFVALTDSSTRISIDPTNRILYDPNGRNVIQFDDNGAAAITNMGLSYATAISGTAGGRQWPAAFYGTEGDNNIIVYNTSTGNYVFIGYRENGNGYMSGYGAFLQPPDGLVRIECTSNGQANLLLDGGNGIVGGLNTTVNYFGSYGDGNGNDADVAFFTQAQYGGGIINERMRIQGTTGYVGINTGTPAAYLDVNGNGRFTGPVHLEPAGDLSMGEFTYDPDAGSGGGGSGDGDSMRGGGFGMGMGAGGSSSGTTSGSSGH